MNCNTYTKYKPSGIDWLGDVPEHWDVRRSRFCLSVNPKLDATIQKTDEVSFVPMESVGEWGGINLVETRIAEEVGSGYTPFKDGDVVIAKITPCFENGKGALAINLLNGVAYGTTELHVLRVGADLDQLFLFFLSISASYRKLGEAEMYGAGGQKRVPTDFCKDFPIPLPPLSEQRTIANFLNLQTAKIDALVAKKRELIEKLKEKRTALISHAVTRGLDSNVKLKPSGIDWLGDVPEHWEVWKTSHGFGLIGSGTTPSTDGDGLYEGVIPWVTTSELREKVIIDTSKKVTDDALNQFPTLKLYPEGTLLIAMYGATIGRLGILGVEACTNQACCAFALPQNLSCNFTYYWFWAFREVLISFASGGGQPNLNQDTLKSLRIPAPSNTEQIDIAKFLDQETEKIDVLVTKVETAIERLQEYRTALITDAVNGKIKIPEV